MKPFALLPAKNRLPKQDTVFLRRNCLSNGCRTCMLLRKRFAVSPRNLSCQKFILFDQEPRIDLFFSAVSGMEMKKIVEIRAGLLFRLAASPLNFAPPRSLLPQRELAIRLQRDKYQRSFMNDKNATCKP